QAVLKKVAKYDVQMICALHGPILKPDLAEYLGNYDCWSTGGVDAEGVLIAYTSVYDHTKKAAYKMKEKLEAKGQEVEIYDLARCDISFPVGQAFSYGKVVLATTTYNADIFPFMRTYIEWLKERNFANRKIGLIENGSWAPTAAKVMKGLLEDTNNTICETVVTLPSILTPEAEAQMDALVEELLAD
ncbi:MAG: FprA family A-type flavoprotein, partial [Clostridia bacterium]|nr:FprA family A-type flavoprotein [Clostridia bacterium]